MVTKTEFIPRYIERLVHILKDRLPEEPLSLQEMTDEADKIIRDLLKY